jgi:hypothetical protein
MQFGCCTIRKQLRSFRSMAQTVITYVIYSDLLSSNSYSDSISICAKITGLRSCLIYHIFLSLNSVPCSFEIWQWLLQFPSALHPRFCYEKELVWGNYHTGCAVVQAGSLWLPTEVDHFRARVKSFGIYGGQIGTVASFLGVLQFPLPISPPAAPHSSASIIRSLCTKRTQSHSSQGSKTENIYHGVSLHAICISESVQDRRMAVLQILHLSTQDLRTRSKELRRKAQILKTPYV